MRTNATSSWKSIDWLYLIGLGIVVTAVYIYYTGHAPISDPTESNYTLTAKEMLLANDWLSPMIYGHYWYDKPIFTYWMLILSYKAFGITDFAARLPGILAMAISAMGMVWGTFKITKQRSTAWFAGIALATTFECWYISHAVITDNYLFMWSLGTFFGAYIGITEQRKWPICFAYICAGFAVLTKGPVGIVLPGIAFVIYLIGSRKWSTFKLLFHPLGLLLFFIVAGPWYGYMYYVHGSDFITAFLGLHNYTRALVSEYPNQHRTFMYFWLTPVSLLPWTILTIYGLVKAPKNALYGYQICWFLCVFIFYCLVSTKYITYTYIGLIPLVLFAAQGLNHMLQRRTSPFVHISTMALPLAVLVIAISAILYFQWPKPIKLPSDWHWILAALIPLVFTVYKPRNTKWVFSMVTIAMACCCLCMQYLSPDQLNEKSGKSLCTVPISTSTDIFYYNGYSTSYVYYSGHPVTYVYDKAEQLSRWKQGTMVMPMAHMDTVESDLKDNPNAIFLVPNNQMKAFTKTRLYPHMTVMKTVNGVTFYRYHAAAQ